MIRILQGSKLVIASHNRGKASELIHLLKPYPLKTVLALDLNLPKPKEDGATFLENALIKARSAAKHSNCPALADDSGLTVSALDGAPGVLSARFAGPDGNFSQAMGKVAAALANHQDKSASFICALALCWPDGQSKTFEGAVHGHITWPPRGSFGFGYDPIFIPNGFDQTMAELPPRQKQAISHRADAFRKLAAACLDR